MSNKIPLYILITANGIIILLLGFIIFKDLIPNKTESVSNNKVTNNTVNIAKNYTAEEIINLMKEKNEKIGKVVVYTEETDKNHLLGRPNQYTSKIQFEDTRVDQSYLNEGEVNGGTIEVFASKEDMENRKSYIQTISSQSSLFTQYIYAKGYAILRLESDITPEQAKEYEELFYQVVK